MFKGVIYYVIIISILGCKLNGKYTSQGNRYYFYISDSDNRYFYLDRYLKSNQIFSQGNYQKIGFGKYLLIPDDAKFIVTGKSKDSTLKRNILFLMDTSCISNTSDYEFYSVDSQKTISLKAGIQVKNHMDSSFPVFTLIRNGYKYYLDSSMLDNEYNVFYIKPSFITNMSYGYLNDTGYILRRFGKIYYTSKSHWYKAGWRTSNIRRTNGTIFFPIFFYCSFKYD